MKKEEEEERERERENEREQNHIASPTGIANKEINPHRERNFNKCPVNGQQMKIQCKNLAPFQLKQVMRNLTLAAPS